MPISPNRPHDVLLIGETAEAQELIRALLARGNYNLLLLHEQPADILSSLQTIDGFSAFLSSQNINLIVNASSAYDHDVSTIAAAAALNMNRSILRVIRPAWGRDALDSWIEVDSISAAADICRWYGKRILITLGESDLTPFAGNDRCHFVVRLPARSTQPLTLSHHDLIIAQGPFAWVDERRLMMEQNIDLLVSRNVGGHDGYAKIDVARDLAIPIIMIRRPILPVQQTVETVVQALTWIDAWHAAEADYTFDK